jgi:hypothetical protein
MRKRGPGGTQILREVWRPAPAFLFQNAVLQTNSKKTFAVSAGLRWSPKKQVHKSDEEIWQAK